MPQPSRGQRWLVLSVAVCGPLLALAGTGGAAAQSNLRALLLGVRQLPKGWEPGTSAVPVSGGCLNRILSPTGARRTGLASATFITRAGDLPLLTEQVATFTSTATAYTRIVTALKDCKHFTGSSGTAVVHGAVGTLSLPKLGAPSAAFVASITINGITSAEDIVVVSDRSVVMELSLADVAVNPGEFATIAKNALAKIGQALGPAAHG